MENQNAQEQRGKTSRNLILDNLLDRMNTANQLPGTSDAQAQEEESGNQKEENTSRPRT